MAERPIYNRRVGGPSPSPGTSRKGDNLKGDENMEKAIKAIEAQQAKVKARSAPWMVGEQLKDMIRREPGIAELIAQDLTAGGMSLTAAEAKIKAFADKHRTGNFACVTPAEAEGVLREYFGIPKDGGRGQTSPPPAGGPPPLSGEAKTGVIDLADFF